MERNRFTKLLILVDSGTIPPTVLSLLPLSLLDTDRALFWNGDHHVLTESAVSVRSEHFGCTAGSMPLAEGVVVLLTLLALLASGVAAEMDEVEDVMQSSTTNSSSAAAE